MKKIFSCRSCCNTKICEFFDLGLQPLANSFLKHPNQKEKFYPLSLSWCAKCNLVQLNQTVNPKELFSNYVWVTSTSKIARNFSEVFCRQVLAHLDDLKVNYVLEIGSNDGTFLHPFVRRGFEVLGMDPASNIVEMALQNGIPTKCAFFGLGEASRLLKEKGPAQIIIARNVLPHVANTCDFVEGLAYCLDKQGILVVEVHYGGKIVEDLHYDSIYHEHLCYFTLKTLENLLNSFRLYIFDIGVSPINAGGLIVYARKNQTKKTQLVRKYEETERMCRLNDLTTWKNFAKDSHQHCNRLSKVLNWAKKRGKVAGFGASARSSTLLNFCGIDSTWIRIIADDNRLKQGLYTPGSHILIESPTLVMRQKPDFMLILAWNFASGIIGRLKKDFNFDRYYIYLCLKNQGLGKKALCCHEYLSYRK